MRDEVGQRVAVGDGCLAVELAHCTDCRHVDRGQQLAAVVGHEAIDRLSHRRSGHAGHSRTLPLEGRRRDVGSGDGGEHVQGEVSRLETFLQRGQTCGTPFGGLRSVEAESRARRQQRQTGEPRRVPRRDILGDHPAERDSGEVDHLATDRLEEIDDRIGERLERRLTLDGCRPAVPGHVPRNNAMSTAQALQLRLPRQATATKAVQQHEHRTGGRDRPGFAPRERCSVDVPRRGHPPSLA